MGGGGFRSPNPMEELKRWDDEESPDVLSSPVFSVLVLRIIALVPSLSPTPLEVRTCLIYRSYAWVFELNPHEYRITSILVYTSMCSTVAIPLS